MLEAKALASALRQAIGDMQAAPSSGLKDVQRLAVLGRDVNEKAIAFLSELPPFVSERPYVALQLIRAAFDHGRGLLYLLETNPHDLAGSALALFRSQIENFLRGAFLGFLASDEELEAFLTAPEGIFAKSENGQLERISPKRLAKRVTELVDRTAEMPDGEQSSLAKMVEAAWSPLCGFVHGGATIHEFYRDRNWEIGSNFPPPVLIRSIGSCYAITNLAFCLLIAHVHELDGIPNESPLARAMEEFMREYRLLRARH
jgi:hypothetical protein